jgi:hypothetical protein
MFISELIEAFSMGVSMPVISHETYQRRHQPLIKQSVKISDVRGNLQLYRYSDKMYLLVKANTEVLGNLNVTPITIAGKSYPSLDVIFIDVNYRKTSAIYWLLYSVKETVDKPIVADGAIFADGQKLIRTIDKYKYFNVRKINTTTGQISQLNDLEINDADHAYLFTSAKLGFGKNMFESTQIPFVWYPLFDDIE